MAQKQIRLYLTLNQNEEREVYEAYARDIFEGATSARTVSTWAKDRLMKHL